MNKRKQVDSLNEDDYITNDSSYHEKCRKKRNHL